MEKTIEDDIRELESEIDSAVDRLFIEKAAAAEEKALKEAPAPGPSLEREKGPEVERFPEPPTPLVPPPPPPQAPLQPTAPVKPARPEQPAALVSPVPPVKPTIPVQPAPPVPPVIPMVSSPSSPYLRSVEKMEAQLLSLEWEISREKLGGAKEEILVLKDLLKQKAGVVSVLGRMGTILDRMMADEGEIDSTLIRFLLDSKETIKLLMKEGAGKEIEIYKQLAYQGIESRFARLQGERPASKEPVVVPEREEPKPSEPPPIEWKRIEEFLDRWGSFSDRIEAGLRSLGERLAGLEEESRQYWRKPREVEGEPADITVFEISGELFGVETDKVRKLFKAPETFLEQYGNQERVRLKEFDVRMIDLTKRFAIRTYDRQGELRILVVNDGQEDKGLMIGKVLKRLLAHSKRDGESGEPFSGTIRWTYQGHPREIPILDLRKV